MERERYDCVSFEIKTAKNGKTSASVRISSEEDFMTSCLLAIKILANKYNIPYSYALATFVSMLQEEEIKKEAMEFVQKQNPDILL